MAHPSASATPCRNGPPGRRSRLRSWLLAVAWSGAALVGRAQAAELVVRDAHADVEMLPTGFAYQLSNGTTTRSGNDSFDSNYGLGIGGTYSFAGPGDSHGFLAGVELAVAQATYAGIGHLTSYGLRAEGGYGYAASDSWTLLALAHAGYGLATFDITSSSVLPALSTSGSAVSYGATLTALYTITDTILIDAKAGYLKTSDKLSGGGIDLTLDNAGFLFALGITYRFSTSPRSLE